jgi:hypothetical protein
VTAVKMEYTDGSTPVVPGVQLVMAAPAQTALRYAGANSDAVYTLMHACWRRFECDVMHRLPIQKIHCVCRCYAPLGGSAPLAWAYVPLVRPALTPLPSALKPA